MKYWLLSLNVRHNCVSSASSQRLQIIPPNGLVYIYVSSTTEPRRIHIFIHVRLDVLPGMCRWVTFRSTRVYDLWHETDSSFTAHIFCECIPWKHLIIQGWSVYLSYICQYQPWYQKLISAERFEYISASDMRNVVVRVVTLISNWRHISQLHNVLDYEEN